jgi:hypothetical protein
MEVELLDLLLLAPAFVAELEALDLVLDLALDLALDLKLEPELVEFFFEDDEDAALLAIPPSTW